MLLRLLRDHKLPSRTSPIQLWRHPCLVVPTETVQEAIQGRHATYVVVPACKYGTLAQWRDAVVTPADLTSAEACLATLSRIRVRCRGCIDVVSPVHDTLGWCYRALPPSC